MFKDYVTPFERKLSILNREITLDDIARINKTTGLSKFLFELALKPDPICVLKKKYRYWRNYWRHRLQQRMAASLVNPSQLTQVRFAVA
jgi:hypothetical protein